MHEQAVGPLPAKAVGHHVCLQPPCVNPDHIEWITQGEHLKRHGSKERYKRSKLKWAGKPVPGWVLDVRYLYDTGRYSTVELARMFETSQAVIWRIVNRKVFDR